MAEQQVNLADLNLEQLQEVKKQLDQEIEHLTSSYSQLKSAQAKFKSCASDVEELKPSSKGKQILVPLTSSLYVPGRLADVENVIVDVGTGYYVKKNKKEALAHYNGKTTFVQGNLETLQKTIERKQENAQIVVQVLQMKVQEGGARPAQ
ncbi:Prefoldin [Kockovaella imperatae]|uniref:Prefoldin n=1 Tax=Kockovaella imperatae TaxID=4999 RepID=A0A1Y1U7T1_9TREE|nr:Prefoldin [Kockovaella imperatae]ORX33567.1 Prefoldin [Kockovaella imperatae]